MRTNIALLLVAALLPTIACTKEPRDIRTLVNANGRFLQPTTGKPYDGPIVEYYADTAARLRVAQVLEGLLDGKEVHFWPSGDTARIATYDLGLLKGSYESISEHGCLRTSGTYAGSAPSDSLLRDGEWTFLEDLTRAECRTFIDEDDVEAIDALGLPWMWKAQFDNGKLHGSVLLIAGGDTIFSAHFDRARPSGTWRLVSTTESTQPPVFYLTTAEYIGSVIAAYLEEYFPNMSHRTTIFRSIFNISVKGPGFPFDAVSIYWGYWGAVDSIGIDKRAIDGTGDLFRFVGAVARPYPSGEECVPSGVWTVYANDSPKSSQAFEATRYPCYLTQNFRAHEVYINRMRLEFERRP